MLALPIFGGSASTDYHSRYFYFSSVGPSLLIGWALIEAGARLSRIGGERLRWAIPCIGLVGVIALSHVHLRKTESIFWAMIGRSYLQTDVIRRGIEDLKKGILGAPEYLRKVYYQRYGILAGFVGINPGDVIEKGLKIYPDDPELIALYRVSGLGEKWQP